MCVCGVRDSNVRDSNAVSKHLLGRTLQARNQQTCAVTCVLARTHNRHRTGNAMEAGAKKNEENHGRRDTRPDQRMTARRLASLTVACQLCTMGICLEFSLDDEGHTRQYSSTSAQPVLHARHF